MTDIPQTPSPSPEDTPKGVGPIELNVGEDAGDLGDQGEIAADDAGATAASQRISPAKA